MTVLVLVGVGFWRWGMLPKTEVQEIEIREAEIITEIVATVTPEVSIVKEEPIIEQKTDRRVKTTPVPNDDGEPWGVSRQIGEYTWTMKIGEDPIMATPREILEALNDYRRVKGSQVLTWDQKLADYAQERAVYLDGRKNVDQHQGFNTFLKEEDGFNKLGFTMLGENISYGYRLNGTHIIEWMYAGDKPHDDNQLDNRWNYVGIGVKGLATCVIFGTGKL